jgi:hypothetical protein
MDEKAEEEVVLQAAEVTAELAARCLEKDAHTA